jgi:hypothetical protein
MKNANNTLATKAGLSTLERAKFGPGMLLQHGDLELLNSYTRELSRLMFRSLFGCGVVCGLEVTTAKDKCDKVVVKVTSGVALACSGDPVYVPKDETIPINDDCETEIPNQLWVVLCGTVKCCAPRPSLCPDDEDAKPECTRERDGYVIKVIGGDRPKCVCGCDETDAAWDDEWDPSCKCVNPDLECYKAHYNGECGCECDDCSDCKCECILLARLEGYGDNDEFRTNYRVRRFVRPVLMKDPRVVKEEEVKEPPPPPPPPVVLSDRQTEHAYLTGYRVAAPEVADKTAETMFKLVGRRLSEQVGEQAAAEIMGKIEPREIASEVAKDTIRRAEDSAKFKPSVEERRRSDLEEIRKKLKADAEQPGQVVTSKAETKKKQTNPKKSTGGGTQ